MTKYKVTISRITARTADIEVEASNEQSARILALDDAGSLDFNQEREGNPDYEVESVEPDVVARGQYGVETKIWGDLAESGPGALDDLVHDLVSGQASNINNEGAESQVRFIILEMGKDDGVKAIKEALEWRGS